MHAVILQSKNLPQISQIQLPVNGSSRPMMENSGQKRCISPNHSLSHQAVNVKPIPLAPYWYSMGLSDDQTITTNELEIVVQAYVELEL